MKEISFTRDLEDIIALVDGRPELLDELRTADDATRQFVATRFGGLLSTPGFEDALAGHLPGDEGSQARLPIVLQRLQVTKARITLDRRVVHAAIKNLPPVQQSPAEADAGCIDFLLHAMANDAPEELEANPFELMEADERRVALAAQVEREGQGTFRARLLDAYDGRCAITGEHTELVLDAAHIQPYLGPRSNHLQNGLLLTKEFHTLFDRGYVTITPDRIIRVSPRLRTDYQNGRRYYPYDGQPLAQLPGRATDQPSPAGLAWHNERVFRRVA